MLSLGLLLLAACGGDGKHSDDSGDAADSAATSDMDGDGWSAEDGDCDDGNAAINPEATDVVGDGGDQNCDGVDGYDGDGDGVAAEWSGGTDCDDEDPTLSEPSLWYADDDGDGWGNGQRDHETCEPSEGWVQTPGDCDDGDSRINPDQEEIVCDGLDNDCDPSTPDLGDGVVPPQITSLAVLNGGLYDFEGELWPTVALEAGVTDAEADLGTIQLQVWYDGVWDGAVDTAGEPDWAVDLVVDADAACDVPQVDAGLLLQVGGPLAYNTTYEFAMVVLDASGNASDPAIAAGSTPRSDGSDGDGSGP